MLNQPRSSARAEVRQDSTELTMPRSRTMPVWLANILRTYLPVIKTSLPGLMEYLLDLIDSMLEAANSSVREHDTSHPRITEASRAEQHDPASCARRPQGLCQACRSNIDARQER